MPCQGFLAQVGKWFDAYKDKGLVIIDIYDGSKDKELKIVDDHIKEKKAAFTVAYDAKGTTTKEYGVMGFPTGYLIGVDGTVIWEGPPLQKVKEIEAAMEKELAKVKTKK